MIPAVVDGYTDTCRAGGVEILGLHDVMTPRDKRHSDPVLDEYTFVPYYDVNPCPDTHLTRYCQALTKYAADCLKRVCGKYQFTKANNFELGKETKGNCATDENEIKWYDERSEYIALKVLRKTLGINGQSIQGMHNLLDGTKKDLTQDPLVSSIFQPRYLHTCLNVVIEHLCCESSKLTVTEFSESEDCIYSLAVPILSNHNLMLQVDYKIAVSRPEELNHDHLNTHKVQSVCCNTQDLDLSMSVVKDLQSSHLLIANQVLHRQSNISATLMNLSNVVTDNGFILIVETTHNFPLAYALEGIPDETDKERSYGRYLDESQWVDTLQSNGFEVVAQKSDNILYTLFLCRKRAPNKEPRFLYINDMVHYSWVDELKEALEENSGENDGPIWLVANEGYFSGVVGMVNTLRLEHHTEHIR